MTRPPILQVDDIAVTYSQIIPALRGVSLTVHEGEIVALLGGNGAGKTTTLKAISRLVHAERGELTAGRVLYRGVDVTRGEPWTLVERGLVQVLEGRRCFVHLSVEENLRLGAFVQRPTRAAIQAGLERVYAIFPRLKERRGTLAGYTSGGEQQMVAIGRALMAQPALVLLDEPSMGLAPQVVEEIFEIIATLNREAGVSVLLAEQNATVALRYAQRGYVLEGGRVVAHGAATELARLDALNDAYLGGAPVDYGAARRARREAGQSLVRDVPISRMA
jgi:branched-chain amino acid transport system ATP-binding protein